VRRLARVRNLLAAFALCWAMSITLSGCGPSGPAWVDNGGSYSTASLSTLYARGDISKLASQASSNAVKLRHDALTGLRGRGGAAAAAADLVTKTLPASTRGVPVYVERATINGKPGLIIIEATGPASGALSTKRLWALSETGAVLFVGTR